ncbi:MAG: SGNH/GDSL hydrolase family protein [Crocinitomicaceae bacterium]|nr:SGNH/GDSL hydrolase family protein [Crocinitomicaceae bacterium]
MNKKIVIAGNSVGVRIRPFESGDSSYSDLLRREHNGLVNLCASGEMIGTFSLHSDKIIREKPDVVILQFGIVELSSRSTSRALYNYLHYRAKRTSFGAFVKHIINGVESKLRSVLVHLGFKRSWYRTSRFLKEYEFLVSQLTNNSDARVICMGVNIPNDRVEKQLPGSRKRVTKANEALQEISKKYTECYFIDVNHFGSENYPDGIHYSAKGHREVLDSILELMKD